MDALSIIFGSKQQNQSSIKTLNDTVSQMGIDDISFISMKGYKWFDGFCIEGDIILKKGNVKIEQKI